MPTRAGNEPFHRESEHADVQHTLQRCWASDDPRRSALYFRGGAPESRDCVRLEPGETVSFATYFGAFPAGYWSYHDHIRRVRASLDLDCHAVVDVMATDQGGRVTRVARRTAEPGAFGLDVACNPAMGWMWLEVTAADEAVRVSNVRWETPDPPRAQTTATVAITTFDRHDDCTRLLERLAAPELTSRVARVIVVDQGRVPLGTSPDYDRAADALGDRLTVIAQLNMGGSGGFSRGMVEALGLNDSHVLLLDDDVDLEPESVLRLMRFADHGPAEMIIGAQMLHLTEPTVLHSAGEKISRGVFWWHPADSSLSRLDLARATIENTPELSRRLKVDFNGWWMCLVPVSIIRRVGAALPFFIKWDDAEFGLRATEAAVRTVSLPGAALWHVPWTAKDDGLDWQAYFQLRNRLVTALIHGEKTGSRVLWQSLLQDVNHLLCAQYGSVRLRNQAIDDILSGPDHLDRTLRAGPARPARILAAVGQVVISESELPEVPRRVPRRPVGVRTRVVRALRVAVHQVSRPKAAQPGVRLAREHGKWWVLGLLDGAIVDAAGGSGAFVTRRSRAELLGRLRDAILLRARAWVRWSHISREYRAAAPTLASPESWRRRFSGNGVPLP
ncbi:glycosyltransferase [Microbacterium invictum]|uniref:Glycosyltransferase n=1 Tax=Microbacterium invictum TaxID=515415 RepID=A0ABZ0V793_9MICO|nr:glycosyltransferase [Microbacterium invictum]WQB69475.1 glycosyltransferase [Microbacterium invictum]